MSDKIVNHFVLADGSIAKYAYKSLVGVPNDLNNIVTKDDLQNGTYNITTPSMHIGTWRETVHEFGPSTNRVVFDAIQPYTGTERVYIFDENINLFLVSFDSNGDQITYTGWVTTGNASYNSGGYFDLSKETGVFGGSNVAQYLIVFRFSDNRTINNVTEITDKVLINTNCVVDHSAGLVMSVPGNYNRKAEIHSNGTAKFAGTLLIYGEHIPVSYEIRLENEHTYDFSQNGKTLVINPNNIPRWGYADNLNVFEVYDYSNYPKYCIPIANCRLVEGTTKVYVNPLFWQFYVDDSDTGETFKEPLVMLSVRSEVYSVPFMHIYRSYGRVEFAGCFYIYTKTGDYYRINCPTVKTFNLTHSQTLVLDLTNVTANTEITTDNSDAFKAVTGRAYSDKCIPIANVRGYGNNGFMTFVTGSFAQFIVDESTSDFDGKTLKLETFKEKYYPYTMRNDGSGWTSRINLLHVTDTHMATDVAYNNLLESINVGNSLFSESVISAVVNTGDNTNGGASTLTNFLSQYTRNTSALATSTAPYLMQLGNHDANNGQNVAIADVPTKSDLFPPFQNIFAQTGVVAGDATNQERYYYYDVTQGGHSIRIIMLDMLDHPDYTANNTNYYCQWNVVYSQDQIDWLANTALDVPADYGVIICNHFPFAPHRNAGYSETYPALNDGYFVQSATGSASGGWLMIPEIVQAWQNRTTISKTYADTTGDQDIVANYDFSDVPASAEFICYLVGHTHSKNVFRVEEENGVSFNQLMMCEDSSGQNGVALNRTYKRFGTISDNAFSCLAIDMIEKKIYRTSFGVYEKCSDVDVKQTQVFDYNLT